LTDSREETTDAGGVKQRHKGSRSKEQLYLGKKRIVNAAVRQTSELEITKQIVGSYIRQRRMSFRTQTKDETTHSLRAGALEALTSLGNFATTGQKRR
jgi:hypothetical protein